MAIKRVISPKKRQALGQIKSSFINGLTPTGIDNYIDNNVVDLASAKAFLKKLSKLVAYMLKSKGLQ